MSIRPAKFCDQRDCDKLSGRDVEVQRGFKTCELCNGDFCRSHHSATQLAGSAFGDSLTTHQITLCYNCDKFATSVFNKRITDPIEDATLRLSNLVKEHLKAQWAAEALRRKNEAKP